MRGKSKKRVTFLAAFFLKKNRRGSNIGMVLAFVIFITFLVFMYAILKPAVTVGEDKTSIANYIQSKIEENITSTLSDISVQIDKNSNPGPTCVKFNQFFVYSNVSGNLIVKDPNGVIQNAYYDPGTDFVSFRVDRSDHKNLFYKVYYSPEFNPLPTTAIPSCKTINYLSNYNITLMTTSSQLFQDYFYDLRDAYNNNYETLKSQLTIPPGNEFGFIFTMSNGTKIQVGSPPKSVNVYATQTPIQYVDQNANLESGYLNIMIW